MALFAIAVNNSLLRLITTEDDLSVPTSPVEGEDKDQDKEKEREKGDKVELELAPVVDVLTRHLLHESMLTRIAVLRWIYNLHIKIPNKIFRHVDELFPVLLKTLSDKADEVILLDLEVLAEIASSPAGQRARPAGEKSSSSQNLATAMHRLTGSHVTGSPTVTVTGRFENAGNDGGKSARQLCLLLNAEAIFRALAEILLEEEDLRFAAIMVQTLNSILLTSTELFELRTQLKDLNKDLRLQLLDAQQNAYLIKALYGLLMLLPQSRAFDTLRHRLDCLPASHLIPQHQSVQAPPPEQREHVARINFHQLIQHFQHVQAKHRTAKQRVRPRHTEDSTQRLEVP
uniref:Protein VAC14 homolog n=1 Tax=Branchiostoma floridae TaxID=7739 RepID=C3YFL8_BRAFL|eukprot:XP_002604971.1 hypothetical protein BRAFLDRAFT_126701 [Branchiostoma floridae]